MRLGSVSIINPRNKVEDELDAGFIPMPLLLEGYQNKHSFEIRKWKTIKSGFTHFANNDLVVAKITPCFQNRKSAIISDLPNNVGAGTTELHVVRSISHFLNQEYLLWLFKTVYFIDNGKKEFTGTAGQQRIGKEYIEKFLVPLPPSNEQNIIVKTMKHVFDLQNKL